MMVILLPFLNLDLPDGNTLPSDNHFEKFLSIDRYFQKKFANIFRLARVRFVFAKKIDHHHHQHRINLSERKIETGKISRKDFIQSIHDDDDDDIITTNHSTTNHRPITDLGDKIR